MDQNDAKVRIDAFKAEYLALVTKYDVDFITFPQYVQTPTGAFETVCRMTMIDKKELGVPSPIQTP